MWTKERRAEYKKAWKEKNPEKVKKQSHDYCIKNKNKISEYGKRWYTSNREEKLEKGVRNRLKHLYSMTPEDLQNMVESQDGKCAICKSIFLPTGKLYYPCIDHSHKSGKIRGLLCFKCNVGLGSFNDDIERLLEAAKYLS